MRQTSSLLAIATLSIALLLGGCRLPSDTDTASTAPAEQAASTEAREGGVELEWDAPDDRINGASLSSSDIAGYRIYIGEQPGQHSRVVQVDDSMQTRQLLRGLKPGGKYYVAVTAIDQLGQESPKSEELALVAEPLTAAQIAAAERRQKSAQRASVD